jgi:ATP-dependent DNA ligase
MDFATLYGEATTGKIKMWKIEVADAGASGATITVTHGYEDGKKQVATKTITVGKNIGKKNETTPLQQAIVEARATWQKKVDSGYAAAASGDKVAIAAGGAGMATTAAPADKATKSTTAAPASRAKETTLDIPAPMLAHDFNKRAKSIKFPCYVQRKYDGTRCVAVPQTGLFSRNRKRYPHLEHILAELASLPPSLILDGELYSTELTFQEIVGLVKRETLKAEDEKKQLKIHLHVYDIISDAPYEDRKARLEALCDREKFKYIKLAETEVCETRDELKGLHDKYVADGYEGIMLRNTTGLYKAGQRSADLQKYKEFEDAEYTVVDFKEGDGAEKGCVIWICETEAGQQFACRPRGTREERVELFESGTDYIGKKLTVRFQELSNDGIPRFPVGLTFRDYE